MCVYDKFYNFNKKRTLGVGIQEIYGASETLCLKRGAWYVKGWPPLV